MMMYVQAVKKELLSHTTWKGAISNPRLIMSAFFFFLFLERREMYGMGKSLGEGDAASAGAQKSQLLPSPPGDWPCIFTPPSLSLFSHYLIMLSAVVPTS
jgi:hypothetical protein